MSYQIINYSDVCSNALLAIIDNDEATLEQTDDDVYTIIVDKNLRDVLNYHVKNLCKGHFQYGKKNIIVNTCRPYDNWRQDERGSIIRAAKYALTDPHVFDVDCGKFEKVLDTMWLSHIKELNRFKFIYHKHLDFYDIVFIMEKHCENVVVIPFHYFVLVDVNREYVHHAEIPRRLEIEVESELRKNKLII